MVIYRFIQNQAQALLLSPFQRGNLHWIGQIHTSHAVGAANSSPLWWCLLLNCVGGRWYFPSYSYRRKVTEQDFIGVKLLRVLEMGTLSLYRPARWTISCPPFEGKIVPIIFSCHSHYTKSAPMQARRQNQSYVSSLKRQESQISPKTSHPWYVMGYTVAHWRRLAGTSTMVR